jgi:hypothetical protein
VGFALGRCALGRCALDVGRLDVGTLNAGTLGRLQQCEVVRLGKTTLEPRGSYRPSLRPAS